MGDDQDCIQELQEESDHSYKEAHLEDLLTVGLHDLHAVDNLDSHAGIQEDNCKEQEDHRDDHQADHLDDQPVDPLNGEVVARADQYLVQAPDLRTLHCS